jgi:hypothetical protein
MEAPRGALRHYNADELEPLSRAGLEALLMEIQDEYHLREGEDQLYVDATKPIRALLRKRRRESVGLQPPATQVIEAVDAPLGDAPNPAVTTKESDCVAVGTPKFGKAKDMQGYEYPEALGPEEFQEHLSKEASAAQCAKVRKPAAYVKKPKALESEAGEKAPKKVSTAGSRRDDVGSATVLKRPTEYPYESLTAQGNELYCNCCGTAVASDSTGLKRHLKSDTHQKKIKVWGAKHETKAQSAALLQGYKAQEQTRLGAAAVSSPALAASVVVVGMRGMETVSSDVQVHRLEILEALLEAGVAASKVNKPKLKAKLEGGGKMCRADHLVNTYIGPILYKDFRKLKEEMGDGALIGITTDATTQEGEAFCLTSRWADNEMKVQNK